MLTVTSAEPIAHTFGLGDDPVLTGPVARGEVGQIWKLTTGTSQWAIKEAFEAPSHAEAAHDATLQEAAAASGIHVPHVRRTADGEVLAMVAGSLVRAYSWVDLCAGDPTIDPAPVGRIVASIHRLTVPAANPVHPWYTDPVGTDAWDQLIGGLVHAEAPFAERLAEQRDELLALEALVRAPTDLRACHRDLFADNVLATPSGDLCVIDWENSGLADPSQELAVVLFEYGRGDHDRTRRLYEAYIDGGGPGRVREPGDFSMLIAQLGHIGEIACRRWLDPTRTDQIDRNTARISEFLDERLTLDAIERILAATQLRA